MLLARSVAGKPVYFGHSDPRIIECQGQNLVGWIDDADLSQVIVTNADGGRPFYVHNDGMIGTDTETVREAAKTAKRARRLLREHREAYDFSRLPTPQQVARLKRKAAEAEAGPVETRQVPRVAIMPMHPDHNQPVRRSAEHLRQAVGAETGPTPPTLADVFAGGATDPRPQRLDFDAVFRGDQ